MKLKFSGMAAAAMLAVSAASVHAQEPIRIGYATDMSGACGPLVDGATTAFRYGVEALTQPAD